MSAWPRSCTPGLKAGLIWRRVEGKHHEIWKFPWKVQEDLECGSWIWRLKGSWNWSKILNVEVERCWTRPHWKRSVTALFMIVYGCADAGLSCNESNISSLGQVIWAIRRFASRKRWGREISSHSESEGWRSRNKGCLDVQTMGPVISSNKQCGFQDLQ